MLRYKRIMTRPKKVPVYIYVLNNVVQRIMQVGCKTWSATHDLVFGEFWYILNTGNLSWNANIKQVQCRLTWNLIKIYVNIASQNI